MSKRKQDASSVDPRVRKHRKKTGKEEEKQTETREEQGAEEKKKEQEGEVAEQVWRDYAEQLAWSRTGLGTSGKPTLAVELPALVVDIWKRHMARGWVSVSADWHACKQSQVRAKRAVFTNRG